jgi:hypothetical protein
MSNTVNKLYEAKVNALNDNPYIKAQVIKAEQNGIDTNDTILGQLGTFGNTTYQPLPIPDEDVADVINQTLNETATTPSGQTMPKQGLLSKIWGWLTTPQ